MMRSRMKHYCEQNIFLTCDAFPRSDRRAGKKICGLPVAGARDNPMSYCYRWRWRCIGVVWPQCSLYTAAGGIIIASDRVTL